MDLMNTVMSLKVLSVQVKIQQYFIFTLGVKNIQVFF